MKSTRIITVGWGALVAMALWLPRCSSNNDEGIRARPVVAAPSSGGASNVRPAVAGGGSGNAPAPTQTGGTAPGPAPTTTPPPTVPPPGY